MRPARPGWTVVGCVGLMARLVFTSPFLSPAVGISRTGMGAHWSSCPVGDSTSVNPSSHMQMPACRGQCRTRFGLKSAWRRARQERGVNSPDGVGTGLHSGTMGRLTCCCSVRGSAPVCPQLPVLACAHISPSHSFNLDKSTASRKNQTLSGHVSDLLASFPCFL